ncbi:carbohydrate ABC transporter substrate-binding protein (CUT1 family) [Haloactinopolyspora alba]|uniref:Carbohydrate ABC transporter substrate-binding protein (CUT1 family) n=1 Tax=Haloactinopolyspora alba TaxID=648780 RepID=A0A2P8EG01_9ACTN|nr:extracellular solute-binding protein [Haloactinopolyspora alba]PSL08389.1 carbohydrate ABC transporter substrate-binding protein (CUT1 family) [Haloactinopolyspora alba]
MNQKSHGTMYTRRRILQMFAASGLVAVPAACAGPGSGGGGDQGGGGGEALPTDGPVEGEISFAHWRAEDQAVLEKMFARFSEEYPDASVSQDISPSNDYQSNALQRIRSGNVGDLFVAFRGAQFVDMVDAGLYADLSGTDVVERYDPALIDVGQSDGTQYGLPYQLVFNQPVSNLDILESVGVTEPPPDWDSFLAMCEDVVAAGLVPMAWPGGEIGNAGHLFNCMVMNNAPSDDMCAKIESGEYACTDDWFLTTLAQYAELRPYFQPNATGTAVEPAQQLFAQGDAALLVTGSFHITAVRELGAQFPVGMAPPVTVSADERKYVGIRNATFILGVNTASDNQAGALELLRFLSETEAASTYANGTVQHLTVADVTYDNEDLAATSDWLSKETLLAPRFQFTDLDIRNAAEQACIDVVGGDSPEQAAEKAQGIIDQRIGS